MGSKYYLILAEWLNNMMIYMLWYIGSEWVFAMLGLGSSPVLPLLTGIIILCAYLARVYIDKLFVFMGVHCLELAFFVFLPMATRYKVAALLIYGIVSLCDLFFWTGEGVRSFGMIHPVAVVFILAVFVHASWSDIPLLIQKAYVCGILFMAIFFVRTYLQNAIRLSNDMQVNSSTPLKEMLRNNGLMVLFLVLLFTACMFFARSDSLARGIRVFIHLLSGFVKRMILFILSLFIREGTGREGLNEPGVFENDLTAVSAIPTWLLTFLQAVEKLLITAVLAVITYYTLKGLVAFVRLYFCRHGYDLRMTVNEEYVDKNERIRPGGRRRRRHFFAPSDERERVRRKYKKKVEALRRSGYMLKRDHTPRERSLDVGDYDFEKLTEKYENLRYGKE